MNPEKTDWFFNSIIELQGDLFAYAFSIAKSRMDAEDAVQNTIIKAYDGLPKLKSKAKLRPWLFKILRNECLLIMRGKKRRADLREDMPEEAEDVEESIDLGNAVGSLSEELREVIVLYYKLGYSTAETAKLIGVPQGTVMSRLARARDRIRSFIEGENGE